MWDVDRQLSKLRPMREGCPGEGGEGGSESPKQYLYNPM